MFAPHRRPAPAEALPEWEPDGLPANGSILEKHRETDALRVNPDALSAAVAAWEAEDVPE